jgi:HD-GYP domain-containing protein (c-di-GMP phosphodiesterase class II)
VVLQESAYFLAERIAADLIAIGSLEGGRLEVSSWPVSAGAVAACHVEEVSVDGDFAIARAIREHGVVRLVGPLAAAGSHLAQMDLAQMDLAQMDLAQMDLAQMDLAQMDLAQMDLAKENLANMNFDGAQWVVAVPLVVGRKVVGGLALEGMRQDAQPADDELLKTIGRQLGLAVEHARVSGGMERSLRQTVTVLAALIEERDAYTEAHCEHIAETALGVGVRLGLASHRLDLLTYGGWLHDIGKVSLPDGVLLKPGPLSADEFTQMKTHASIGEEVLRRIEALREVAPIVGQHHERFDGTGYPRGLKGEKILLEARILTVADAFDAMTSTRPYRAALSWQQATDEIKRCSGSQFDPDVAQVFLRYMEGEEAQWRTTTI